MLKTVRAHAKYRAIVRSDCSSYTWVHLELPVNVCRLRERVVHVAPPAVMALLKKKKKDSLESKQPSCLCHAAHHWREAADLEDNADKHEASQACPGQCFEWCVHKQLIDMRDDVSNQSFTCWKYNEIVVCLFV